MAFFSGIRLNHCKGSPAHVKILGANIRNLFHWLASNRINISFSVLFTTTSAIKNLLLRRFYAIYSSNISPTQGS